MRRSWSVLKKLLFVVLVAWLGVGVSSSAVAQDAPQIDVQHFTPAVGPDAVFSVHETDTLGHLKPTGRLVVDYSTESLLRERNSESFALVEQQLASHLLAGIGLWDVLQIGAHMPVYILNDGTAGDDSFDGGDVGDLGIQTKLEILPENEGPVGVGALVDVRLPTGAEQRFVGADSVVVTPKILFDKQIEQWMLALNVGARFQSTATFDDVELGNALTFGVGTEFEAVDNLLTFSGEIFGHTGFSNFFGQSETPIEGLVGAKLFTDLGLAVEIGAGGGLAPGIGAPQFRTFLGVSYADRNEDRDDDGVLDDEDECPTAPEDLDGFQDNDGCPDLDNDQDGVPDTEDRCPMEPGEDNGCPDEETDTDGDGVPDTEDQCVEEPEDEDGYEDADGCPDPDNDGDGVVDEEDDCPMEPAGDVDQDGDGCPDADADGDGVGDEVDECPEVPGLMSREGCPPEQERVELRDDEIVTTTSVEFIEEKAVLTDEAKLLLEEVALVLRTHPSIRRVEVQGHTDATGSEQFNQRLSEERARAVRTYLIDELGIAAERLVAEGYGATQPLEPNNSEENRARNRRIEFNILERQENAE